MKKKYIPAAFNRLSVDIGAVQMLHVHADLLNAGITTGRNLVSVSVVL